MRDGSKLRSVEAKNNTHDVMSGKVGKYTISLIKSRNIEKGDFLVSTVSINGKIIWSFKEENFNGRALLMDLDGVLCVCLVSRAREVERVIPLETLVKIGENEDKHQLKKLKIIASRKIRGGA